MAIPKKLVELILARDHGVCVINGPHCTGEATVADHRANRGAGGSKVLNDPRCLIASCWIDNQWKEDSTGEDRWELERRGVIVLKAATNADTVRACAFKAVEYPDGRRFFLLDYAPWREEINDPPF
jgi:hypothetical protein